MNKKRMVKFIGSGSLQAGCPNCGKICESPATRFMCDNCGQEFILIGRGKELY